MTIGSSAATAGPTILARAAWTTCWPLGAMSRCCSSTARCIFLHRRAGVEGDAAGRGRQVRGGLDCAEKDLAMQAIAYGNVYVAG